MKFLFGKVFIV